MGYPMSDEERDLQTRARDLMNSEFIPYEVEAEMNRGELPDDVIERQRKAAAHAGLHAINMPRELGGGGFTTFEQTLVQEQVGRVTNGLAWIIKTPAAWLPEVATADQIERYVKPTIRGERQECFTVNLPVLRKWQRFPPMDRRRNHVPGELLGELVPQHAGIRGTIA